MRRTCAALLNLHGGGRVLLVWGGPLENDWKLEGLLLLLAVAGGGRQSAKLWLEGFGLSCVCALLYTLLPPRAFIYPLFYELVFFFLRVS